MRGKQFAMRIDGLLSHEPKRKGTTGLYPRSFQEAIQPGRDGDGRHRSTGQKDPGMDRLTQLRHPHQQSMLYHNDY